MNPAHRQAGHALRLEWGPTGGAAVAHDAEVAVVVDVLSFTTTLTLAVERGIRVHPHPWGGDRGAAHAASLGAVLAVGRSEARERPGAISLSPARMLAVAPGEVERLVLPSPNGSTICAALAQDPSGPSARVVVAASLCNASAVARWLAPRVAAGQRVALVPSGERWPDGSLRPALEDLWGAGAVLAALDDLGVEAASSPEADHARESWRVVRPQVGAHLVACASGQELVGAGFADDVDVAAGLDRSAVVPVLHDGVFSRSAAR